MDLKIITERILAGRDLSKEDHGESIILELQIFKEEISLEVRAKYRELSKELSQIINKLQSLDSPKFIEFEYYTIDDLAKKFKVKDTTIYKWQERYEFPPGELIYYEKTQRKRRVWKTIVVDAWVTNNADIIEKIEDNKKRRKQQLDKKAKLPSAKEASKKKTVKKEEPKNTEDEFVDKLAAEILGGS